MSDLKINAELLRAFERELDPRFPERNRIPTRVLGYGEISTVLEIGTGHERKLAYKRLSMFRSEEEVERYEELYEEYVTTLQARIGLKLTPGDTVRVVDEDTGRVVLYIAQINLPGESIGHKAIHSIPPDDVPRLVLAVLREFRKVFGFNQEHRGELEIGFDGQISNWAIVGFDPGAPKLAAEIELLYLDTSTPLMRRKGEEQLDPELFLRNAPPFLNPIIRLFFLKDVMARYYDFRRVVVDLLANFCKEQLPEMVPGLIGTANEFLSAEAGEEGFSPITEKEVRAYYREDAWIWRTYLAFRKIDRSLHRLLGWEYAYILPGKIKR